jgi:CBS domain containing-hemolysin-like protein
MNSAFTALPVRDLARTGALPTAKPLSHIGSEDSAVHLLTDFAEQKLSVLNSDMSVSEARLWMKLADTSFKVVENQAGDCLGILAIEDVNGEKPMSVANRQGGALKDLRVRDIMRPVSDLPAIHYRDLRAATVGDLVSTFREVHEEYLLVLDDDRHQPSRSYLRGLVCARELLQRLDLAIDLEHRATKFYEIVHVVNGGF